MKALLVLITACLIGAVPVLGDDVVSGKVVDSVTGAPISNAIVKCQSTQYSSFSLGMTDASGNFSLTIRDITIAVKNPVLNVIKTGSEFNYSLLNASGRVVANGVASEDGLSQRSLALIAPMGICFLRIQAETGIIVYKVVNNKSGASWKLKGGSVDGSVALTKMRSLDHVLEFSAAFYNPATRTVSGSQSDLTQKLVPTPPPTL